MLNMSPRCFATPDTSKNRLDELGSVDVFDGLFVRSEVVELVGESLMCLVLFGFGLFCSVLDPIPCFLPTSTEE